MSFTSTKYDNCEKMCDKMWEMWYDMHVGTCAQGEDALRRGFPGFRWYEVKENEGTEKLETAFCFPFDGPADMPALCGGFGGLSAIYCQ